MLTEKKKEHKREYMKEHNKVNSIKKDSCVVKAKCPACGKVYQRRFDVPWIGNGMPRVYCRECEHLRGHDDGVMEAVRIGG